MKERSSSIRTPRTLLFLTYSISLPDIRSLQTIAVSLFFITIASVLFLLQLITSHQRRHHAVSLSPISCISLKLSEVDLVATIILPSSAYLNNIADELSTVLDTE